MYLFPVMIVVKIVIKMCLWIFAFMYIYVAYFLSSLKRRNFGRKPNTV